ncbi:hypothetical protein LguiA_004342 [Lonicera macranthoides]
MMTRTAQLFLDENLDVHHNGGAPIGGKTNVSKPQKHGGIVPRKALKDLSNSAKPSEIQLSRKKISMNVSKGPEKSQVGRRKALSDLTNSVNQPSSKKIQDDKKQKKLISVAEEENFPKDIAGECFLHNHQECVKARTNNLDMKRFLNLFGLDDEDMPLGSPRALKISKPENGPKVMEMEIPELMKEEVDEWKKIEPNSPICASPKSQKPLVDLMMDYSCPNFILMESP